ncbi:six-hairpin glycosidase [Diaporthe eres]|nr:six-hairpin glycosidase [Diaporthe eres]
MAAAKVITSDAFRVTIDDHTGALIELADPQASTARNWVGSSSNTPWQPLAADGVLDTLMLAPAHCTGSPLDITVQRTTAGQQSTLTEKYLFKNVGNESLNLASRGAVSFAIYTPFNDHYTNTSDALQNRAHAHIWTHGGSTAWVKMNQMGGHDRDLGLVLVKGALSGYSVEGRDKTTLSNTRGVFLLHPVMPTLDPGEQSELEWRSFGIRAEMTFSGNAKISRNIKTSKDGAEALNSTIFLNSIPSVEEVLSSRIKFITHGMVDDLKPLERFMLTLESFYTEGGPELYAIGLPIYEGLRALNASGDVSAYERALSLFQQHGQHIMVRGLVYPAFEVNFELSIVAPAAVMLLELYRWTGDKKWLAAAEIHFETLLRFSGKQPDYRVHDIAIRHWDGYCFGKDRMWGDVFPHYWSTLNAVALHHYGQAVGQDSYGRRAEGIIRSSIALFDQDGRGSCAWIYPTSVNGRPGHYADPYENLDGPEIIGHVASISRVAFFTVTLCQDWMLGVESRKGTYEAITLHISALQPSGPGIDDQQFEDLTKTYKGEVKHWTRTYQHLAVRANLLRNINMFQHLLTLKLLEDYGGECGESFEITGDLLDWTLEQHLNGLSSRNKVNTPKEMMIDYRLVEPKVCSAAEGKHPGGDVQHFIRQRDWLSLASALFNDRKLASDLFKDKTPVSKYSLGEKMPAGILGRIEELQQKYFQDFSNPATLTLTKYAEGLPAKP